MAGLQVPRAEPLSSAKLVEPDHLAEAEATGQPEGSSVRHLGADDDVTIGHRLRGPVEGCGNGFGGVSLPPVSWQEGIADFEFTAVGP